MDTVTLDGDRTVQHGRQSNGQHCGSLFDGEKLIGSSRNARTFDDLMFAFGYKRNPHKGCGFERVNETR